MQPEQNTLIVSSCMESCSLMRHVLPKNRLAYLASLTERGFPVHCNGGHESQMMRVCDQPEVTKQVMHADLQAERRKLAGISCIAVNE